MKKQNLFLSLLTALVITCLMPVTSSFAAGKTPVFTKKYSQITVGKSIYFSLKHVKKSYKIIYTSSSKKIALINKKTGKCTGKKSGKCTIYAKIYNKKNKKIKTLKQNLKVVKSSLLPNASFHLVQSINPFNYTVKIGCDRILLKKEVQKSNIKLKKSGSTSTLTASFSDLSANGKEVTYTLTSQSQKKLCPKNGTMDGIYTLSSSLFPKKISLSYQERIGNYSLSGYVFSVEGSPVNQAYVKCMSGDTVKTCSTDSNGYYHLEKVKNPSSLTVTKSGYLSETLTDLTTSSHATRCENFYLHSERENKFSAQIHVTEQSGTVIPHASVSLFETDDRDKIIGSGETDDKGNIFFYTANLPASSPCTKWSISQQVSLTYESNFSPDTSNSKKINFLSLDKNYTLLIGKFPKENVPGYPFRKFTFCPKDYLSQQFSFDVKLSDSNILSLQNLSLKWDSSDSYSCSNLRLLFYQKGSAEPVLKTNLTEEYYTLENHILSFSRRIPYSLPDGSYYIKMIMEDSDQNCIFQSAISQISITGGNCSSKELSCIFRSYARILAYGDFAQTDATASFHRYEKIDGQFFYIDTLTSSPFQGREWDVKTANLILPCTQAGISYLLVPGEGELIAEKYLAYSVVKEQLFAEENIAITSSPLAKVNCVPSSELASHELPPELQIQEISPSAVSHATVTKPYVRSCPTYPNSVTVFYKNDGTFLSASLTTSPSKNIGTGKKHIIMDICTNGKELFTTQESYQL